MGLLVEFCRLTGKYDQALLRRRQPESEYITPEFALKDAGRYAIHRGSSDIIANAASLGIENIQDLYHEGTKNNCARVCALSIDYLSQAGLLSLFPRIGFMISNYPSEEEKQWSFDTYLIAEGIDRNWYAMSPAVHDKPEGKGPLFTLHKGTLSEVLSLVQKERPGWRWPSKRFIKRKLSSAATPQRLSNNKITVQTIHVTKLGAEIVYGETFPLQRG